jgi:hypothetical protein
LNLSRKQTDNLVNTGLQTFTIRDEARRLPADSIALSAGKAQGSALWPRTSTPSMSRMNAISGDCIPAQTEITSQHTATFLFDHAAAAQPPQVTEAKRVPVALVL